MKTKTRVLTLVCLALVTVLVGALVLTACNNKKDDSVKLPTTKYEKVKFAFEGVENSLKSLSTANSSASEAYTSSDGDPLSVIESLYTSGDSQGDVIDDLEYDQPPMIQFQCLKAILEDIGDNYVFGMKYYNNISGNVYMDIETGYEDEERNETNKWAYTFLFSLSIGINEQDLITAQVGFDITISKDSERYSSYWYVELYLDYDMASKTPNYEMSMLTANNESLLPFMPLGHVYEYDYVKVQNNNINEWRKFVLETDETLVRNETHPDFDSYIQDGIEYRADTLKWYKNKDLRKKTNDSQKQAIANALFDLGLNSTSIDKTKFIGKSGQPIEAIRSYYATISQKFRKDVIYALVCRHKDNHGSSGQDAARIGVFMDGYDEEIRQLVVLNDMTGLAYLTTNQTSSDGRVIPCPRFFYMYADGGKGAEITDLSGAQFDFYSRDDNADASMPNVSLAYNDFITSNMENILSFCNYNAIFKLTINNLSLEAEIYYVPGGNGQGTAEPSLDIETEWDNEPIIYAYEDVTIQSMFVSNGMHKEYSVDDKGEKEVANPRIFYINEKGQRASQIDAVEMSFFLQDEQNTKNPYSIDLKDYSRYTLSQLWSLAHASDTLRFRVYISYLNIDNNYVDFSIVLNENNNIPLYVILHEGEDQSNQEQGNEEQGQEEQGQETGEPLHDYEIGLIVENIEDGSMERIKQVITNAFDYSGDIVPNPIDQGTFQFVFIIRGITAEDLKAEEKFLKISDHLEAMKCDMVDPYYKQLN